jgi:hypothetical protein
MPTFVSQRLWPAVVAVGVLGIGGFVYAAIGYVERTSDAAFAEFLVATASPTSNPDQSGETSPPAQQPQQGRTGCPAGKRELPTQLIPLR